jgi:hypothetical protein
MATRSDCKDMLIPDDGPIGIGNMLWDSFLVISASAFYILFGIATFERFLFPEVRSHHRHHPSASRMKNMVRLFTPSSLQSLVFTATFTLACLPLHLFCLEIVDTMHRWNRELCWQVSVHLLTILLTIVIPFVIVYNYIGNMRQFRVTEIPSLGVKGDILNNNSLVSMSNRYVQLHMSHLFVTMPLLVIYWRVLIQFTIFFSMATKSADENVDIDLSNVSSLYLLVWPLYIFWSSHAMRCSVCSLGIIGITIAATLSGMGAVSMPLDYLKLRTRSADEIFLISQLEHEIMTCQDRLSKKKIDLLMLSRLTLSEEDRSTSGPAKRLTLSRSGDVRSKEDMLKDEISMLEQMSQDMFLELIELNELHTARIACSQESPLWRHTKEAVGVILVLVCAVRVCQALLNVVRSKEEVASRGNAEDMATRTLTLMNEHHFAHVDVRIYSRLFSIGFVSLLVISSTRGFILTVARSRFMAMSRISIAPDTMSLITTLLFGCYLLSSQLLLRVNVPCQYRIGAVHILGHMEFGLFHQWFDTIFALSTLITATLSIANWSGSTASLQGLNKKVKF